MFIEGWNTIVRQKENFEKTWRQQIKEGTELEQIRALQMQDLVGMGPIREAIPELVQNVLESILVKGDGFFEISFLDGTGFQIHY